MGYDVHITRAEEWSRSKEHPITLDEWLAYVDSDAEMRLDGFAEVTTPSAERLRIEARGIAVWTAYSRHSNGATAWFSHRSHKVTVTNPDAEVISKMARIAAALGAHVQGDEGERCGPDGRAGV
jgi:hypothetical protein